MAQTVSTRFTNAQASPANLPVAKVELSLGNYFSAAAYGTTVAASGSDASGNYPAAGAIDGDRTEINIGAPATADNFVGKSSWRSAVAPSTTPQTLTMTLSASRILNRIKLYHLSGHGLSSYKLEWWNGSTWIQFAATSDLGGAGILFTTTGTLDVIDFDDVTTTQVRLTVYGTAVAADKANVVEIEAYRLVDVTERIKGVTVSRQRDYKLANPMAATVQLDCINTDRFFSISHTPTAAEVAQGFVNSELKPNVQILVHFGFNVYGAEPELVPAIVAYLDSIAPNPGSRTCRIIGRDGMKALLNRVDSTNLKTNTDITDAIRYMLNRNNVSNYDMDLDTTSIILPYFFTNNEDHLTTIRSLVEAAGDATFFFDEMGTARFKFFTGQVPLAFIYPVQADWSVGTFTGNMFQNGSDQLALNVQQTSSKTSSNSGFTSQGQVEATSGPNGVYVVAQSFQLPYGTTLTNVTFKVYYRSPLVNPANAKFRIWNDNGGQPGNTVIFEAAVATVVTSANTPLTVNVSPNIVLAAGIYWYGLSMTDTVMVNTPDIDHADVNRTAPAQTAPTLPAPYPNTLAKDVAHPANWVVLNNTVPSPTTTVKNLGTYTFKITSGSGTWTSAAQDTGTSTTSYLPLNVDYVLNGNPLTNLNVLTQSSADGVHWNGFFPVAPNFQPQSPVLRYLQVQIRFTQSNLVDTSIIVSRLQINWIGGSGDPKYPPAPSSFTFDYNSNLIAVEQELADNLGGDTSIINDVQVQATPLALVGTNSDTVWQGTNGSPPTDISPTNTLPIIAGVPITVAPYISSGMDITHMSGANPSAAVVVFGGGGAGSWAFSKINPTTPVLVITPSATGTITDLRLVGKLFASETLQQVTQAQDAQSIQLYGGRRQNTQNKWIPTYQLAQAIANNIVSVFKNPFSYIPSFTVQPTFSMQIGDRITVHDINLDVNSDYVAVGVDHDYKMSGDRPSIQTTGRLLAVPSGF